LSVKNLDSWHGSAIAVGVYKGSVVTFDGDAQIEGVVAGSQLTEEDIHTLSLPNARPFVCGIFVGPNSDIDMPEVTPQVHLEDGFVPMAAREMYGYDVCDASQRVGEMGSVHPPTMTASKSKSSVLSVSVSMRSMAELATWSWHKQYSTLAVLVGPLVMCVALVLLKSRCFTRRESGAMKSGLMEDDCHSDYGSVSF